jgi:hypothetical protein
MKKEHHYIRDLLKVDPLHEAELITGKDSQNDRDTTLLGLGIQMEKSQKLEAALKSIGDTTFSNQLGDYLSIVQKFGFKIIYKADFVCEGRNEQHFILWHPDLSILLNFDTFTMSVGEPHINSGNFYYNWSPHCGNWGSGVTSSGGFVSEKDAPHLTMWEKDFSETYYIPNYPQIPMWDKMSYHEFKALKAPIEKQQQEMWDKAIKDGKRVVWHGDHDCREALITKIKALYENGIFLNKWKECSFPWLTNYGDHKDSKTTYPFTDLYEKTIKIINSFPEHVKNSIGEYNKKLQ